MSAWKPIETPDGELAMEWCHEHLHALSFRILGDDGEPEYTLDVKWDGCINGP